MESSVAGSTGASFRVGNGRNLLFYDRRIIDGRTDLPITSMIMSLACLFSLFFFYIVMMMIVCCGLTTAGSC